VTAFDLRQWNRLSKCFDVWHVISRFSENMMTLLPLTDLHVHSYVLTQCIISQYHNASRLLEIIPFIKREDLSGVTDTWEVLLASDTSSRMQGWEIQVVLGTFAELRKATISFACSVCQKGTTRLPLDGFSWNFIFRTFRKPVDKIQDSLKSDKDNGYFPQRPMYVYGNISLNSS
jgi:hypothetical protein